MENSVDNTNQNLMQSGGQTPIPNATAVLVLGIISIPTCFCYGIVGLIIGIIALILSGKAKKLYLETPENFTLQSFNNLNAGRICAIIGTILSSLYMVFIIIYIIAILTGVSYMGDIFDNMPGMDWDF